MHMMILVDGFGVYSLDSEVEGLAPMAGGVGLEASRVETRGLRGVPEGP